MNCAWCNKTISDRTPVGYKLTEDSPEIPPLCIECWEKAAMCNTCFGVYKFPDDISYTGENYDYICHGCATGLEECDECGKGKPNLKDVNGKKMCASCAKKYYYCEGCSSWHTIDTHPRLTSDMDITLEYPCLWLKHKDVDVCLSFFKGQITSRMKKKSIFVCERCGERSSHVCVKDGQTYHVCRSCAIRLKKCTHCKKWHAEVCSYGDLKLCPPCKRNFYTSCSCCNTYKLTSECEDHFCNECRKTKFKCTNCGNYHMLGNSQHEFENQLLCTYCYSNLKTCKKCSKRIMKHYNNYLCRQCSLESGYGKIESYNLKPTPVFHGKGELHYGFENEVSFPYGGDMNCNVANILKHFNEDELIIKSDSSIDNGFEIVSHPFTFEGYKDKKWERIFLPEMRVSTSCGMHIHVNLASFTSFHLYKFVSFIHKHPTLMTKISERNPNSYCELYKENDMAPVIKKYKKSGENSNRYRRVNLGKKTIELRCFAGATKHEQWMKNIEFIHALYEYTLNTSNMELNPRTWKLFIVKNKKMYPNLFTFMSSLYTLPV